MTHWFRALLIASLWVPAAGCNRAAAAAGRIDTTNPADTVDVAPATAPVLLPAPTTREAVGYLASDELEGRGVGTKGIDLAADYIATQFKNDGLKTLPGLDGYFQRFEMTIGAAVAPGNTLTSGGDELAVEKSFKPLSFSASSKFTDVPIAFAGYGISSAKQNYDDYANLDTRGKAVLVMRFAPHNAEVMPGCVNVQLTTT